MPNNISTRLQTALRHTLSDVRVELLQEFDRNFTRQAFFNEQWQRPLNEELADKLPQDELCRACKILQSVKKENAKSARLKAKPMQGKSITLPGMEAKATITGASIKEWTNQPHKHFIEKNRILLDIEEVMKKSEYKGAIDNYEKNPDVKLSHIFQTSIKDDLTWIIIKEYKWRDFVLHSISDSKKIIDFIKKEERK